MNLKLKKFLISIPFLFGLVLLALIIKFYGLFQNGILPGWDTMPWQYASDVMAKEFLPNFKLSGYNLNWSGGFPLFHFYPPLIFILVCLVYFLSFKLIPLFLSFRIFTFLSLFAFSVALYFFTKEFLNKKAAKASILFGLFLIFFYFEGDWVWIGQVGARAHIFMGLFASAWGLVLFLLYFAFLERLRQEPSKKNFLITAIVLTCLFLSHTLSTVVAGIFLFIYLLFHHQREILKNAILTGLIAVLLSGFYFIPFVAGLKYTSAEATHLEVSPFYIFFPFKYNLKISNLLPFLIFILFIIGTISLFKKQKFFLPFAFIIALIFLFNDHPWIFFSDLPFHYEQFVQYFSAVALAVSSYGFIYILGKIKKRTYLKHVFMIFIVFLFVHQASVYESGLKIALEKHKYLKYYYYQLNRYSESKSAREVIEYFEKRNPSERIFAESPMWAVDKIGSPHYFTSLLPLNGKKTINGLPVEGSIQNFFIMPTIIQISENIKWGKEPLRFDSSFNTQPSETMLDRLKIFNVGYIIVYSDKLKNNLRNYQDAELLETFGNFQIYKLKNPRDLVYQPAYKPGLFISQNGEAGFRDFAQWWYKFPPLLDFPIAESVSRIEKLDKEEIDNFSIIIVSAEKLNQKQKEKLVQLGHPIIWLTNQKNASESVLLSQFNLSDSQDSMSLVALLLNEKKKYPNFVSNISIGEFTDERVSFVSGGSTIINLGYFPYWQSVNKDQKVYQVTPGQILVLAEGETILEYRSDWLKKASIVVSWLTLLGLIGWGIKRQKLKIKMQN